MLSEFSSSSKIQNFYLYLGLVFKGCHSVFSINRRLMILFDTQRYNGTRTKFINRVNNFGRDGFIIFLFFIFYFAYSNSKWPSIYPVCHEYQMSLQHFLTIIVYLDMKILSSMRHLAMTGDIFGCHNCIGGTISIPCGRGQGFCQIPYDAQENTTLLNEELPTQNVSSAEFD